MATKPLVSVIMPVFNGQDYVKDAIDSILSQEFKDFECIIINDGSTDHTQPILTSYRDRRIKIISHKHNQGIVPSLNDGINISSGTYIARMDADDISDPKRLSIQVKFLDNNPRVAVVGTFLKITTPSGKLLFTIEQPTRDQAIKRFLLQDSCLAHGSVMMRKKALVDVGMYNPSKQVIHAEDYDLFTRLAAKYELANIPQYLYTRKEHQESVSHQNYAIQQISVKHIRSNAKKIIILDAPPLISVLMPTYNKGRYIEQAIKSVISQTMQDWELVIIDDGSTDDTRKIVKRCLHDKRITYLENPVNIGKARTRNRLINDSLAEIVCELDSDDTLTKDALSIMYKAHQSHPKHGFIYSQFVYCDKDLKKTKEGFCRSGHKGETNLHTHYASALRTYKRKFLGLTSGFDVNLSGAEDLDMIYKIEEVAPIMFIDQVLYLYRMPNQRNSRQNIPGIINGMKAQLYAYLRRRSNKYPNISAFELGKKLVNQSLIIMQNV